MLISKMFSKYVCISFKLIQICFFFYHFVITTVVLLGMYLKFPAKLTNKNNNNCDLYCVRLSLDILFINLCRVFLCANHSRSRIFNEWLSENRPLPRVEPGTYGITCSVQPTDPSRTTMADIILSNNLLAIISRPKYHPAQTNFSKIRKMKNFD